MENNDEFGLKILKNGFVSDDILDMNEEARSAQYISDAIILEKKEMNTFVKNKYLDDITDDLISFNKQNAKYNRVGARSMQYRTQEM